MGRGFNPFSTERYISTVDRSYYPKDFSADIERYRDERGHECDPVDSEYDHPDYSVLEGPRLEYYLWWRRMADEGELLKADWGYAWLRCCELINSKDDPDDVLTRMIQFTRVCSGSIRLAPLVSRLAEDYALANGLSLGRIPRSRPFSRSMTLFTWDLTRYPIRMPDPDILLSSCYNWRQYADVSIDQMAEIVSMTLAGIDEMTRSSEGKGFIRAIGCEPEAVTIWPFEGFADYTGAEHRTVPSLRVSDGPLHDIIDAIVRTVTKLTREDGVRGPQIPRAFPQAYRRIAAAAVDAVLGDDPFDARHFRCASVEGAGFWGNDDLVVEREEEDDRAYIIPQAYPDPSFPRVTLREISTHMADSCDDPVEYTPSEKLMPTYSTMEPGQISFYIHWRTMAREGTYLNTDSGYIWLYCVELINSDDDPECVQSELERALDAYSHCSFIPQSLCTACADHAILNSFDVPPAAIDRADRYVAYSKLACDPPGRMSVSLAEMYSLYDSERYTSDDPGLYSDAFTLAVRRVDAYMKEHKGRRIIDRAGSRDLYFTKRFYQGLWTPKNPVERLEFVNVLESKRVNDLMDGIFRTVIRVVNTRLRRPVPRAPTEIRQEYREIAEASTEEFMDSIDRDRMHEAAMEEASRIVIDRDAVESAAADLEAVRGMMSVDEPDRDGSIEESVSSSEQPTGWDALRSSLDDVELLYLTASLTNRGAGAWTLEGTGRRPQSVEDSVNSKAMDAIGDAIMEGGTAFEDYVDDIRRIID